MKKIISLLLFATAITTAWSQNTVKGKIRIRNATDSPAGVTVMVKGSHIGTVTDSTGSFQLQVASLPVTLSISSVGYQPVDVLVISKDAGSIMIEPAVKPWDVVIVGTDRFRKKAIMPPSVLSDSGITTSAMHPLPVIMTLPSTKKALT